MSLDDDGFRRFAETLTEAINSSVYAGLTPERLLEVQAKQFIDLIQAEREFREALISSKHGFATYRAFISHIRDNNRNILTARPYFRERQEENGVHITKALKHWYVQDLYQFNINYNFVAFVMKSRDWPPTGKLARIAQRVAAIRDEIVKLNMPLAISQARIFWNKAPLKTNDLRFVFMDFVQLAADGLLSAVDKFCVGPEVYQDPAKIRVWRAVAIGRVRGNMIQMFSETTVHFYPTDKKKLYWANKHLKDFPGQIDFERLASRVNASLDLSGLGDGLKTTGTELAGLMGAAANSLVTQTEGDDETSETPITRAASPSSWQPDVQAEKHQLNRALVDGIRGLSMIEQKLLKLKGVELDLA